MIPSYRIHLPNVCYDPSVIATLTRTSEPARKFAQVPPEGCPLDILVFVENNLDVALRKFIFHDIRSGHPGGFVQRLWSEPRMPVIIQYHLVNMELLGPEILRRTWKIEPKSQEDSSDVEDIRFAENLVRNVEWFCPAVSLFGSMLEKTKPSTPSPSPTYMQPATTQAPVSVSPIPTQNDTVFPVHDFTSFLDAYLAAPAATFDPISNADLEFDHNEHATPDPMHTESYSWHDVLGEDDDGPAFDWTLWHAEEDIGAMRAGLESSPQFASPNPPYAGRPQTGLPSVFNTPAQRPPLVRRTRQGSMVTIRDAVSDILDFFEDGDDDITFSSSGSNTDTSTSLPSTSAYDLSMLTNEPFPPHWVQVGAPESGHESDSSADEWETDIGAVSEAMLGWTAYSGLW